MSEYQYYEFQAIDRPLTAEEQEHMHSLSSRVELTPRQAIFTYSYGDFRGEPLEVLEHYFDALLYIANWGTTQLAFRFPHGLIDRAAMEPYCIGDSIVVDTLDDHVLLNICINEEEGKRWIEGEGELTTLLPLRDDLVRGDLRVLYLAWLKAAQLDDSSYFDADGQALFDDGVENDLSHITEPPVPPNLQDLTPALRSFIDLFEIDPDLVGFAATQSATQTAPADQFAQWITLLPAAERDDFLLRLVQGEPMIGVQLTRRLRELGAQTSAAPTASTAPRRTLKALQDGASEYKQQRVAQERAAAQQARQHYLEELARRESAAWEQVFALIEEKKARPYDEAVALLVDLRDLATQQQKAHAFQARLQDIHQRFPTRHALIGRLHKAGLV